MNNTNLNSPRRFVILRGFLILFLFFSCLHYKKCKLINNNPSKHIAFYFIKKEQTELLMQTNDAEREYERIFFLVRDIFSTDKLLARLHDYFKCNYKIENNNFTLCQSLKMHKIDCKNLCIIYYSILLAFGTDVKIVFTRNHLFLKINGMYYETLNGQYYDLKYYKRKIDDSLVSKGIYIYEIDDKELEALFYESLGNYFYSVENFYRAVELYKKGIMFMPANPSLYNNLGNSYAMLGFFDDALDNYRTAISLDNKNSLFWNNIGLLYLQNGKYLLAGKYIQKAIDLEENALYYSNLAIAFYNMKQYDNALYYIDKALSLEGDNKNFWYIKSLIYYLKGDYKMGKKCYNKIKN